MQRVLLFGNSGSGKSTLARKLSNEAGLACLDLDTLAWLSITPPQRASLDVTARHIEQFLLANEGWVIEGCYSDLLELVAGAATEIIFLNLSIDDCQSNARKRPWEPHKYPSKEAQDANLQMLLQWIGQYRDRDDEFSYAAHSDFYNGFKGSKRMICENQIL